MISSALTGLSTMTVRSTSETVGIGTSSAKPFSLPLSSGRTVKITPAAPVEAGMMFSAGGPEVLVDGVQDDLGVGVGVDRVHRFHAAACARTVWVSTPSRSNSTAS